LPSIPDATIVATSCALELPVVRVTSLPRDLELDAARTFFSTLATVAELSLTTLHPTDNFLTAHLTLNSIDDRTAFVNDHNCGGDFNGRPFFATPFIDADYETTIFDYQLDIPDLPEDQDLRASLPQLSEHGDVYLATLQAVEDGSTTIHVLYFNAVDALAAMKVESLGAFLVRAQVRVRNLPYAATEDEVREFFTRPIPKRIEIIDTDADDFTQAVLWFSSREEAEAAVAFGNGEQIGPMKLRCSCQTRPLEEPLQSCLILKNVPDSYTIFSVLDLCSPSGVMEAVERVGDEWHVHFVERGCAETVVQDFKAARQDQIEASIRSRPVPACPASTAVAPGAEPDEFQSPRLFLARGAHGGRGASRGRGGRGSPRFEPDVGLSPSTVKISDLPNHMDEDGLREMFREIDDGEAIRIAIKTSTDQAHRKSLIAFALFQSPGIARQIIETFNYRKFGDVPIHCILADKETMAILESGAGNLYVKSLEPAVEDSELHESFSGFGEIVSCRIATDAASGKSLGYGYVQFRNPDDAQRAMTDLNGATIGRRQVQVSLFTRRQDRSTDETYTNVYIENLLPTVDDQALKQLFSEFGIVVSPRVLLDPAGRSQCRGFCSMMTNEMAANAVAGLNGRQVGGRKLKCNACHNQAELSVQRGRGKR
jgi:RNA recognition motif-containing protein